MQRIEPANQGLKFCLVAICVIVLSITLSAGLWPFSLHRNNNVKWNADRVSLHFGDRGMIVSRGKFEGLRMSGTTDLITNTSGAAFGAWLYLNKYTQTWLERCALIRST
jgi:hypothetical protein